MRVPQAWRRPVLGVALACLAAMPPAAAPAQPSQTAQAGRHDGQHDFDFNIGVWRTHIRRMKDPFADHPAAVELSGTVSVRKVWGGRAQLEEIEADGPEGHWQGLTLFVYNPDAHQWSQAFANSRTGVLGTPLIGEFSDGRGELLAQDTFQGRTILVRGVWSDIGPDAHRYTESYSDDGGRTWRPMFLAELTRLAAEAPNGV